jgi:hypothetical protein
VQKALQWLSSDGVLTRSALLEMHQCFTYESEAEYSGWIDPVNHQILYKKHDDLKSVFPWQADWVFHTHPKTVCPEHSWPDLYLFACSSAKKSILFTERKAIILHKNNPDLNTYLLLRKKLSYLKNNNYLERNINSFYFYSILEKLTSPSKPAGSYQEKFRSVCQCLEITQTTVELS